LYQGVITVEVNYFLYSFLPCLSDSSSYGVIYQLDKLDLAMMFDMCIFFSNFIIYFINDLYWTYYRRSLMEENEIESILEFGKKDSKETGSNVTKLVSYIQTVWLLDIVFLTMIMLDDFQQPMSIFYWFLVCDTITFLILFIRCEAGSEGENSKLGFFILMVILNFSVTFIWAIILYCMD
jgi:hypothetical protein